MFKKWICTCFGINTDEQNNESISFNQIKKIIIVETGSKLPDINDKWKVIKFFDIANNISETILGDTIEFILQNPNEIPYKNSKAIQYTVNMFNKKTRILLNRLTFYFKYDSLEMGQILMIKPAKNEIVSSNHWSFIESLFYNMGFQIRKQYHKK